MTAALFGSDALDPKYLLLAKYLLLEWYQDHHRVLPWRSLYPQLTPVYQVWLSESMLQQTQVQTVVPYYQKFLDFWPIFDDFAKASLDQILRAWSGLGYYRRAHHMYHAAQQIVQHNNGVFPTNMDGLRGLSGVGDYTASAIAAIAFDHPVIPVDGNIRRIFSRLYSIDFDQLNKKDRGALLQEWVLPQRNCDLVQALMDLGSTICTPKNPQCAICPLQPRCQAYYRQEVDQFPVTKKSANVKQLCLAMVVIKNENGQYWMTRREDKGLWAGTYMFPSLPENELMPTQAEVEGHFPELHNLVSVLPIIRHSLTHREVLVQLYKAHVLTSQTGEKQTLKNTRIKNATDSENGQWVDPGLTHYLALSTLMKKVMRILES